MGLLNSKLPNSVSRVHGASSRVLVQKILPSQPRFHNRGTRHNKETEIIRNLVLTNNRSNQKSGALPLPNNAWVNCINCRFSAKSALAAMPALMQGGGRLIHINGLQGLIRTRPPVLYATVESAVRGLCESLRWEAAPHGLHVSLITLGSVANGEEPTPKAAILHTEGRRDRLSRDEVADAVLFMLYRPAGVNVDELVLTPLGQII